MRKKNYVILVLVASIIINLVLVFIYFQKSNPSSVVDNSFNEAQKKYPLLSKRILLDPPIDILVNFLSLRKELQSMTTSFGDDFGMYFEYLPTGTSIGINSTDEFHAASLFKTPVVMAYYHKRERLGKTDDPETIIKKTDLDNRFGNLWKKGAGYKIKLSEAVKLTLEESDNTAARLLVPFVDQQDFDSVYEGLDIDFETDGMGAILTARSYSSILKSLYFSSVLTKKDSQEILNYLTSTKFPDKLVAGVPPSVTVAHKIGDFVDKQGNQAFMDCGIVYVPRRSYLLCMISKTDEQTARERMQSVSKTVYDYVSSINISEK